MFRVDFCLLSQILRKHHHRHKQPEACFHGDSKSNQVDNEVKAWHLRLTFTLQSSEKSKRLDVQSLLAEIVSQPIDWHMQNQNNGIINGHANMKGRNNWLKNLSQYMKKKRIMHRQRFFCRQESEREHMYHLAKTWVALCNWSKTYLI